MSRSLKTILAVAAGCLLAALTAALLAVAGSLPELDGTAEVAGLHADVRIERDAYGIPVITATNREDLAFATGFVHAQDRFFQMDLSRRNAAGELAALVGEGAVGIDRRHRFHRFRSRASQQVAELGTRQRKVLEAYAAGVNAGLDALDSRPFEYLVVRQRPEPWQIEDTVLVVYTMYLELNDARADRDVQRGLAHRVLPETVFAWLYPEGSEWDAPLAGGPSIAPPMPSAGDFSLRGRLAAQLAGDDLDYEQERMPGSNNWAVAGDLTETGAAIVANDMHLGITVPNVFYRARLVSTGDPPVDLSGVTLPGAPLLVAGSNGHVAWGNTNSYGDWTDAVIVRPAGKAGHYLTHDGPRPYDVYHETIEVAGGQAQTLDIRETIWGPVRDDGADPEQEIAVSWIAHAPGSVNLAHLDLETVTSVEAALDVANTAGIPPQNFVAGDADGNIGWTIAGRIPVRAGYDASLPADWSATSGWTGWRAPRDYPRIVNPEGGRIWTANARVVEASALAVIGDGGYDLGARARQVRDSLLARTSFAPADMLDVQLDDRALFLERWHGLLLDTLRDDVVDGNDGRRQYRDLVAGWVPRAAPESVGYRLVRRFRSEVRSRVFGMLMQPVYAYYGRDVRLRMSNQFEAPLWELLQARPGHLLTDDYADWDALLLAAVDACIEDFARRYDDGLDRRSWGERNTARIRHPLSVALPAVAPYLDMPADPLPGDANLPRAQGPSFGASERFAVSPGHEADGYLHMPAGQSGHPWSPYYRRGHSDWVLGLPSPFLPGKSAHRLVLLRAAGRSNPADEHAAQRRTDAARTGS